MRILHCCLAGPFTDGMNYQENYLANINHQDGHDVLLIATQDTYIDGRLDTTAPGMYVAAAGFPYIRLPFLRFFPSALQRKIRCNYSLYRHISSFGPEVILFHGTCAYDIVTAARYKSNHPQVRLYCDSHEAFYNSARTFLSRVFLHKLIYRTFFECAKKEIDKVLYVGSGEREYLLSIMKLVDSDMEFYPLGGLIISEVQKRLKRRAIFEKHGLPNETVLFVHSGKFDTQKKTEELLRAFASLEGESMRLFIIGSIPEDRAILLNKLIMQDRRILFLGWESGDKLLDYVAAADMYLQPGSVSTTLQNAICAGTPVMIYPHECYESYVKENGFRAESEDEMRAVFLNIKAGEVDLNAMSRASYRYAREFLDYRKLAARLYK